MSGEFNEIKISSGDIEFLKNEKVEINSNFVANINFDEVQVRNMLKNFIPKEILDNKIEIIGSTKNILSRCFGFKSMFWSTLHNMLTHFAQVEAQVKVMERTTR